MWKSPACTGFRTVNICILHTDHTVFLNLNVISDPHMVFNDRSCTDLAVISNDYIPADDTEGSNAHIFSQLRICTDVASIFHKQIFTRHHALHPEQQLTVQIFRHAAF